MIGTQIITRINAGRGAEEASLLIGDQEVETMERSETTSGATRSITYVKRREIRRVLTASEIATRLGPTRDGVRVIFLGVGPDALELTVPYVTLPGRRPASVPAAWTSTPLQDRARVPPPVVRLTKEAADRIRQAEA
jgi:hypothetical protein